VLSAAEGAAPCSRRPPWQAARKYSFPPLSQFRSWQEVSLRLLSSRIIWLQGPVDSALATSVIGQLLLLESESKEKPVSLYINSPGGEVDSGMAIYDTMQFIDAPVQTTAIGSVSSIAALILCGGLPGERRALPNSRMMIHQPSGGAIGPASDIAIHAKEMLRVRARLNELFAEHTGQELKYIEDLMERDHWMTAEEAKELGLIDVVLRKEDQAAQPVDPTKRD